MDDSNGRHVIGSIIPLSSARMGTPGDNPDVFQDSPRHVPFYCVAAAHDGRVRVGIIGYGDHDFYFRSDASARFVGRFADLYPDASTKGPGVILAPCLRSGNSGDWWTAQHSQCTGSQHDACGSQTICACRCHVVRDVYHIADAGKVVDGEPRWPAPTDAERLATMTAQWQSALAESRRLEALAAKALGERDALQAEVAALATGWREAVSDGGVITEMDETLCSCADAIEAALK